MVDIKKHIATNFNIIAGDYNIFDLSNLNYTSTFQYIHSPNNKEYKYLPIILDKLEEKPDEMILFTDPHDITQLEYNSYENRKKMLIIDNVSLIKPLDNTTLNEILEECVNKAIGVIVISDYLIDELNVEFTIDIPNNIVIDNDATEENDKYYIFEENIISS